MYHPNSKPNVSMGKEFTMENDYRVCVFSVRNGYEFNSKSSSWLLVIYQSLCWAGHFIRTMGRDLTSTSEEL